MVECTLESVVSSLMNKKNVPIIGIGASKKCDGQILVTEDILGMTNLKSKFIKKYLDFNNLATSAIKKVFKEVDSLKYPSKKHCY